MLFKRKKSESDPVFQQAKEALISDLMMEKCICESEAIDIFKEIMKHNPSKFLNYYIQFQNLQSKRDNNNV